MVFHYKPSILGYLYFWKYCCLSSIRGPPVFLVKGHRLSHAWWLHGGWLNERCNTSKSVGFWLIFVASQILEACTRCMYYIIYIYISLFCNQGFCSSSNQQGHLELGNLFSHAVLEFQLGQVEQKSQVIITSRLLFGLAFSIELPTPHRSYPQQASWFGNFSNALLMIKRW